MSGADGTDSSGGDATTLSPVLALLAALQAGLPPAEVRIQVGDVTVLTSSDLEGLGRRMGTAAADSPDWLGLGRVPLGPVVVALVPDTATFRLWTRGRLPAWGAGMALPRSGVIVVRADGGDPLVTLRHELAHLALHRRVRGRVPLWFDEGYAVLAAREYGRFAALRLNVAVASGRLPTLHRLDGVLRGSEGDANSAYALAASAVAELGRRHPSGTLDPLLARLSEGVPFDDAVLAMTGLSVDRFADAWHLTIRRRYNWGIWFAAGGVWVVLALVLGWGAAWRRQLDAPRREALNEGWELPQDDEPITTGQFSENPLDPPASSG